MARFWRFFGVFFAGSKRTLPFAFPWTELHKTRFLGLLQAIPPELGVGSGKIPVLADYPNFAPWSIFGVFSAGSKTTLSCAYLWTELHQTMFPVFLQAIPPESSVGNGKTPLLAEWHGFGGSFWRFFGRLQDDAVLRLPLDRITPNSVSCAFAGHSTGIGCWKWKNTSISRLPQFCSLEHFWRFFGRLQDDAVLRLPLDRITPNYVSCVFAGHST